MSNETSKATVLVVDDTPENIEVLSGILSPHYKVKFATNGSKAIQIMLSGNAADIVLLDVMMPGMNGLDVCRQLKSDPRTRRIPVIFVTALGEVANETEGLAVGAVDYITKPVSAPIVLARIRTHLALYDQNRELALRIQQQTQEINTTRLEVIRRLGRAAEYKDNETGLHVIRMSHYSHLLGQAVGLPVEETDTLLHAAPMHDVGKIGIPDAILRKPGALDAHEWQIMKQHPQMGAEIIGESTSPLMHMAREIALTHHEKWNGSGYPRGLKEEDIPLAGRIVALADVFDALTTERPYKKAWTVNDALELIRKERGSHFDPNLVDHFFKIQPEILNIKEKFAETTTGSATNIADRC